jgi:hypothetical protein
MATGTTPYLCESRDGEQCARRLRLDGGEHAVLAVDDRAASHLDDPTADSAFVGADEATVGRMTLLTHRTKVEQQHPARFAEIWEVDELVADDELEEEAAGAEVVRT